MTTTTLKCKAKSSLFGGTIVTFIVTGHTLSFLIPEGTHRGEMNLTVDEREAIAEHITHSLLAPFLPDDNKISGFTLQSKKIRSEFGGSTETQSWEVPGKTRIDLLQPICSKWTTLS
ncbi:MAG: hypothetical protein SFU85_07430 [Candidatus Methylacidiphilales bacterium]|nr:hypothetical protein [Candidatus Methylacidiphilales bacterium]